MFEWFLGTKLVYVCYGIVCNRLRKDEQNVTALLNTAIFIQYKILIIYILIVYLL